jgi:hypothetical protein
MTALANQRGSQRFETQTDVMLQDFRSGFFYNGIVYNYSAEGVYLESDYAPRPGRRIRLKVNGAPDIFTNNLYLAEIKWRRPVAEKASPYAFGVGMQYC